tara:strand:+ start:361 stop:759 length:399 start_codon:yes stop_codon:yes gene_type:complete
MKAAASIRHRGYILFELVIALTIFSIAVLGLARSLANTLEVANILNRDQRLRVGMRSFIEEIRLKPLAEMSTTFTDEASGITYTSSMEPVSLETSSGNTLPDMYNLQVIATYGFAGEQRSDDVSVYVYKPAE